MSVIAPKVKEEPAPDSLTCSELCELGRRLSSERLEDLGFMEAVEDAERDRHWRLQAAAELLEPLCNQLAKEVADRAEAARKQVRSPQRGSAVVEAISSRSHGRRLPGGKGWVITKRHQFQRWNRPKDGGALTRKFRFVVTDPRGGMILLGDDRDVVYGSPSAAARAATGNHGEDGWHFFGVEEE